MAIHKHVSEHSPILSDKTWVGVVPGAAVCPKPRWAFTGDVCDYAAALLQVHTGPSPSAREPKWLEQNFKLIDERRVAGRLSEPEDRAFQSIVAKVNAGDWDLAESLAFALRDAQRGSSEEASVDPRPKLRSPRGRVTTGRQN